MSNSLAAVHPELIAEWSEKNLPLTPDACKQRQYAVGSSNIYGYGIPAY